MIRICRSLLIVSSLIVSSIIPLPAFAQEPPASFADLVEKLSPAVVNISTSQKIKGGASQNFSFSFPPGMQGSPGMEQFREFFEQFGGLPGPGGEALEREVTSLGSGFLIDAAGYVVTNNHVIDEAEEITVRLSDNSKYKAKVIGRDKKTDLALLKVEPTKPLPFVPLGDSDTARVGDWVIAIGNPFGLGGSVTQGIVSARQRSINAGPFDDFLQTDAPINRGNSGGPLFNMKGEVIGITSAIFSPHGGSIGIGFAVPTTLAKPVLAQLKEFGRTHRGWLGVKIQEVTDEIADSLGLPKAYGALVLELTKGSPAEKAGVKEGDVITQFDGKEIKEMRFLPRLVAETKIGRTVPVKVWRKNKEVDLSITLGEMDEADEEKEASADAPPKKKDAAVASKTILELELAAATPELRKSYGLDSAQQGLVVVGVKPNSEAAKRGVREGDLIAELGGDPVHTLDDAQRALETIKKSTRKYALLKIARGADVAFVTLPVGEK